MARKQEQKQVGPRGGTSTISDSGFRRVALYLHPDEFQALRRAAFEEERSMSEIMRAALRVQLGMED